MVLLQSHRRRQQPTIFNPQNKDRFIHKVVQQVGGLETKSFNIGVMIYNPSTVLLNLILAETSKRNFEDISQMALVGGFRATSLLTTYIATNST
jgi:hypothetical protein